MVRISMQKRKRDETRKCIVFDIETTGVLDGISEVFITVAATLLEDEEEPKLWYSVLDSKSFNKTEQFAKHHMEPVDVAEMMTYVLQQVNENGYVLSTFNGLGFDLRVVHDVLKKSGYGELAEDVSKLAMSKNHFDNMYQFFCVKGFAVSLKSILASEFGDKVKKECKLDNGKAEEFGGAQAAIAWMEPGDAQYKVATYCAQDVVVQLKVHQQWREKKKITWITKKKRKGVLTGPIISVNESNNLELPDTNWMKNTDLVPWQRNRFTGWVDSFIK